LKHLNKKALFFDLDGTLLDSFEGISNSFNYAFKVNNREMFTESVRNYIGPPLAHTLEKMFDKEDDIIKMIKSYREYYLEKGVFECKLYDGIDEVLKELKRRGYRLYVATSKPTQIAILLLKRFKVFDYFINIFGAEDDSKSGSKDLVLKRALDESGEDKEKSLMIGDSVWDRKGAEFNGVDFASVMYGFGERDTIYSDDNYFNAETVSDILKYLPDNK